MHLIFTLASITILERPLKLINIIDDKFADEIITKFRDFTLFKYLKDIIGKTSMNLKSIFTEYGSDLFASEEFSFVSENVFFFIIIIIYNNIFFIIIVDKINSFN